MKMPILPDYYTRGQHRIARCTIFQSLIFLVLFAVLSASRAARATAIIVTGYTATPGDGIGQGGLHNYFDDLGHQLDDGVYGINNWAADLGNGAAYEWVGWEATTPIITFQFAGPVTINTVGIDFNRNQSANIYLPSSVTIGGTDFCVASDAIVDATRSTLTFNGSWTGSTLQISLADCDVSRWIFVDEISFAAAPVPEPGFFALCSLSLVNLALLGVARKQTPL